MSVSSKIFPFLIPILLLNLALFSRLVSMDDIFSTPTF